MGSVKLIEVKSELAAGTRGASLGIGALKVASLDLKSDFFSRYPSVAVETVNEILFEGVKHPAAKFIDGVYKVESNVCDQVNTELQAGHFPVVLGGDHSTAYGTIAGIKKTFPEKRLGVIWIDAHGDLHSPYTSPTGNMHGMPLGMALNEDNIECKVKDPSPEALEYWEKIKNIGIEGPKIKPEDIVFIGVRDTEEPENHLMAKHGIRNFTTEEVRQQGAEAIAKLAMERLNDCDMIYVSFDVDSMDPSVSKGTGTPVENGLTVEEAMTLNTFFVNQPKVKVWEIVEVNPTLDTENKMAETAFGILEATTTVIEEKNDEAELATS